MTSGAALALEPGLDPDEFIDVLMRSGLAERRPVRDPHRIQRMIEGADIVLTARAPDGLLIGISRAITDGAFCCYLSDLAVDKAWQGQGVGKALIDRTHAEAGSETKLILTAAPGAETFYEHIGMDRHRAAFLQPQRRS